MFCILCNKHGAQNERNNSKTMRFRKLALEEHAASKQHHAAITAEMLSRVSAFHKEYVNQVNSRDEVLSNVFKLVISLQRTKFQTGSLSPSLNFLSKWD